MLRRLIVLALLAWLPLQSVAAPAFMVLCELGHDAPMTSVHGGAMPHGAHHDAGDDGGESGSGPSPHSCCHHAASGVATSSLVIAEPPAERFALTADTPAPTFILDTLDRPPRSARS